MAKQPEPIISEVLLERFVAGDLSRRQAERVERAAAASEELRARIESLRTANADFVAAHDSQAFAHRLAVRLEHEASHRKRAPLWRWILGPSVAAATGLVLAVVYLHEPPPAPPIPAAAMTPPAAVAPASEQVAEEGADAAAAPEDNAVDEATPSPSALAAPSTRGAPAAKPQKRDDAKEKKSERSFAAAPRPRRASKGRMKDGRGGLARDEAPAPKTTFTPVRRTAPAAAPTPAPAPAPSQPSVGTGSGAGGNIAPPAAPPAAEERRSADVDDVFESAPSAYAEPPPAPAGAVASEAAEPMPESEASRPASRAKAAVADADAEKPVTQPVVRLGSGQSVRSGAALAAGTTLRVALPQALASAAWSQLSGGSIESHWSRPAPSAANLETVRVRASGRRILVIAWARTPAEAEALRTWLRERDGKQTPALPPGVPLLRLALVVD